ncbi:MAG: hypothetical protein FWK01_23335 [Pantanalinema sp. GBBB05]|nr:hypothetical protein [Pantanalinema sp. GBBB05]
MVLLILLLRVLQPLQVLQPLVLVQVLLPGLALTPASWQPRRHLDQPERDSRSQSAYCHHRRRRQHHPPAPLQVDPLQQFQFHLLLLPLLE